MTGNSRSAIANGPAPLVRVLNQLVHFAFRGGSTIAKFLLTLYTARYLGLADLGVYGLVVAAAVISPALLGFGLTDFVVRQIVLADRVKALRKITARFSLSLAAHIVFQPLVWTANLALGSPVPLHWIWLIAPIVLLEHLAAEAHDLLVARGHLVLTGTLQFVRAALWPIVVVGIGLLYPETRTLENIFLGWLLGLTSMTAMLLAWFLLQRAGPLLRWAEISEQIGSVAASLPLYVRDVTAKGSLFIDRYLISLALGLELTGVYIFFWSVANVVHGMIITVVAQPQAAKLIGAVVRQDLAGFRNLERKLRWETVSWTLLLSLAAFIAVILLLPFLQRPALQSHFSIFGLILLATWARVAADEYGFVLLALHRDRAILVASAAGAVASAVLNLLLVPAFGLWGGAWAFLLTGLAVLALGLSMRRDPMATRVMEQPT